MLVSKKDEVIWSANIWLCKLVKFSVMLFIEKKKENRKQTKGKKAWHSHYYSLGYNLK